jgi:nucleotide-binding universal stress UspA family protein
MYKRVLIPVDGSETAEAILPFILEIAGPLDLEVVLLRVNQPTPPMAVEGTTFAHIHDPQMQELCKAYVAGLAGEMRAKGVRVNTRVRRGQPVEQILAAAREEAADLIAMTTHGRTGPARLLFGSVAEGVLRHADIPVFLMRQTEREVARRRREVISR